MANILTNSQYYIDIANAIRNKNGEATQYYPSEMAEAIEEMNIEEEYQLIVKIDTGSIVTASKINTSIVKTAEERNGIFPFSNLIGGDWLITCTLGEQETTFTVTIVEGEPCQVFVLCYQLEPSDFEFYLDEECTTTAALGTDYEIVYDDDTAIPQSEWSTAKNWKIRNLVSLYVKPLKSEKIDVFCVGGGGGGGSTNAGGGGGGYTTTQIRSYVEFGNVYPVVIGAGGIGGTNNGNGTDGSQTSAFGVFADGGKTGLGYSKGSKGGNGGSGGGGRSANGGSDGNDGAKNAVDPGEGQKTTTREFGEATGKLYAGGGGGAYNSGGDGGGANGGQRDKKGENAPDNTGGGGGGGGDTYGSNIHGGNGGSGIVVFRNAREAA